MSKSILKTKVPIAKLAVGMLVTGVDRPWYATPFLSHRMTITSDAEIATLKACGVKMVDVEIDAEVAAAQTDSQSLPEPGVGSKAVAGAVAATVGEEVVHNSASDAVGGAHRVTGRPAAESTGDVGEQSARIQVLESSPGYHGAAGAQVTGVNGAATAAASRGPSATASRDVEPSASMPPLSQTTFEEEMQTAHAEYQHARAAVQRAMTDAKVGRAFAFQAVFDSVAGMADSILRNPLALGSLSRLKSFDQYTYYHSVNTCILAMTLGRQLNMARDPLIRLGLGVVLHDIGKTQVPIDILNKPGLLTENEAERVKQHVMRGVDYLDGTLKVETAVLLPVLEHHERMDGSGYPHHRHRADLSEVGLIAGVVDVYDALTSDRPYRKAVSPHQALKTLYEMTRRGELDTACVERFIRCMGIYPVGSCVRLSSGAVGVVSKINPSQTLNPVVLLVRDSPTGALIAPRCVDLALQSGQAVARIAEVLPPTAVGIAPNDVLDAAYLKTSRRLAA